MNKTIYFTIIVISFSLALAQGKPCCKNKIACKFNQTNIDVNKDGIISDEEAQYAEKSGIQCPNSANINSSGQQKKCSGCKITPWWKFWAKKKNCCNTKI